MVWDHKTYQEPKFYVENPFSTNFVFPMINTNK